jgi:hypothetical protein
MRIFILFVLVGGCGTSAVPTLTGAKCPDPNNPQFTYQNFMYDFNCKYCDNCHDSKLSLNERNGAPLFHNLDSLIGTMEVWQHTDEQAGFGPKAHNTFMPGGGTSGKCPSTQGGSLDEDCVEPTDEERENLSTFIACEVARPQDYNGSNATPAMTTDHCASYQTTGGPPDAGVDAQ